MASEILALCTKTYEEKEAAYTSKVMRELERVIMLRVVDEYWMDHIDAMTDLRQGIVLRAYGQQDPVVEYKREGYEMFEGMINAIKEETIRRLFLVRIQPQQEIRREKVGYGHLRGRAPTKMWSSSPHPKRPRWAATIPAPAAAARSIRTAAWTRI